MHESDATNLSRMCLTVIEIKIIMHIFIFLKVTWLQDFSFPRSTQMLARHTRKHNTLVSQLANSRNIFRVPCERSQYLSG